MAIVALALGFVTSVSAATTDQQNVEKTVDKYLSTFNAPKKGLCVCIGDSLPDGLKRVGIIVREGTITDGFGTHVAVACVIPGFDPNGGLISQMPVQCSDWVPLSK
jgi:hypothetical protein